jgi:uncharacterized protein (DUF3084 family)
MQLPEIQYIAGCEHSTEMALRAALYCAIGIAMQAREDATGAMDAAEADRRGARAESEHIRGERDQARAERDAAREALIARDSAPDLDYVAREALWKMRAERDAAIAEAESLRGELDALAEKLGAATLERDAARDEVTP